MPPTLRTALSAALVVALGACSLPFGGGPTPANMLSRALSTLRDSPSFKISGSLHRLNVSYGVVLSEDNRGGASGWVTDGLYTIAVRRLDGRVLLSDQDFFQQFLQLRVGRLWVTEQSDPVSQLVTALADRSAVVSALSALAGGAVSAAAGPHVGGGTTTWLVGEDVSVLIGDRDPTRPLGLTTTPGRTLAGELSDLALQFDGYGVPLNRDVAPGVVDLADPNTLPINVVKVPDSFQFESCDGGGCTLSQVVRNDGGRNGHASATFTVSQSGKEVGRCLADVPALGNNEAVKVACRLNYPRTAGVDSIGGVSILNSLPG
jgi:hypothetical protein